MTIDIIGNSFVVSNSSSLSGLIVGIGAECFYGGILFVSVYNNNGQRCEGVMHEIFDVLHQLQGEINEQYLIWSFVNF